MTHNASGVISTTPIFIGGGEILKMQNAKIKTQKDKIPQSLSLIRNDN
jgi:hypothetical protein